MPKPTPSECTDVDFSAAGSLGMTTDWIQSNPKVPGSQAWNRYHLYKGSRTILEAKEKGCTLTDLRHDYGRGHLKIRPAKASSACIRPRTRHSALRGKMLRARGKKPAGKGGEAKSLQIAGRTRRSVQPPKVPAPEYARQLVQKAGKVGKGSDQPPSLGRCRRGRAQSGRMREAGSAEECPGMQVEAEAQLSKPQAPGHVSRPTDPDCQADHFRCIRIGEPVPVEVKQLIAEVPQIILDDGWHRQLS
jgi:hypothetical protein